MTAGEAAEAAESARPPLPDDATAGHGSPGSAADSPHNRAVQQVRRLTNLLVGGSFADADLDAAAADLGRLADRLAATAGHGRRPRVMPDPAGHPQDFFPTSPIVGHANPLSPPVAVWAVRGDDGRPELRGRARFGYAYEGPPNCVHGGVIAETFDELLGAANIPTGRAGMTGTLTVRYHRPTPILAELDLVARQTHIEGRKIFAWAGIYHDGELTAEGDGVFIELAPQRFLDVVKANGDPADGTADGHTDGGPDGHTARWTPSQ